MFPSSQASRAFVLPKTGGVNFAPIIEYCLDLPDSPLNSGLVFETGSNDSRKRQTAMTHGLGVLNANLIAATGHHPIFPSANVALREVDRRSAQHSQLKQSVEAALCPVLEWERLGAETAAATIDKRLVGL
jgi:hypothetical protein